MLPPASVAAPLLLPAPVLVPVLAAGVAPRASRSFNHVAGAVLGGRTVYADLNAAAWYSGGGMDLRGPRVAFGRPGLRGVEDVKQRKQ